MLEHVFQVFWLAANPGGNVQQNGLFAQIKANHVRHVRVHRLVVGHASARRIANGHIACCISLHQTGTAQGGVGPEDTRVQKIVVHPAVNHIHLLQALRGGHVQKIVFDNQILALDQFDAHLLRQKRVLVISAVVHAGREHHHGGVCAAHGRAVAQGLQQQVWVIRHRRNRVDVEQIREQPHHHFAVFQHVRHTRRNPQVVFQHVINAVTVGIRGTHHVHPGDVRVNVAGHMYADHLRAILGVFQNQIFRHNAGAQNFTLVVHVFEKAVERGNALRQTPLQHLPVRRRNNARHQIKRDQALIARCIGVFVAIHGKGNAHAPENHFGFKPAGFHGVVRLTRQPFGITTVMGPHFAAIKRYSGIHFVKFLH